MMMTMMTMMIFCRVLFVICEKEGRVVCSLDDADDDDDYCNDFDDDGDDIDDDDILPCLICSYEA